MLSFICSSGLSFTIEYVDIISRKTRSVSEPEEVKLRWKNFLIKDMNLPSFENTMIWIRKLSHLSRKICSTVRTSIMVSGKDNFVFLLKFKTISLSSLYPTLLYALQARPKTRSTRNFRKWRNLMHFQSIIAEYRGHDPRVCSSDDEQNFSLYDIYCD